MLALVAGEGDLPGLIMDQLDGSGTAFRLCELEGYPSEHRGDRPIIRFRIETLGSFIAELVRLGVTQICFAGAIGRPPLDPSKIDPATMPLVPRMMAALQQGDDAALRTVLQFFDEAGIETVGANELGPEILPAPGVLGKVAPSDQHKKDAERGIEIIGAMAAVDVGQACIVEGGQALAIEAQPGTDWMMRSLLQTAPEMDGRTTRSTLFGGVASEPRAKHIPKGGVLVKAAKPGQELRIDMPTIGPDTVMRAVQVGLEGIVIEAGRVIVVHKESCVEIADSHGLFLWVKE
ncbi:UDP-2,3-diacylglucosamine diphosphatase LpxI [uncultured Litoreibacter sp.]|uniref:LpxI family protein n=1 Tax=uncultured Litoreibacter sp. TaxID=1392394 RepID=UPI002620D8A3|nr:UDP-2,3-diacylglucosamine diphosphatase LpxI [uncultured Litoreibacter sp.]